MKYLVICHAVDRILRMNQQEHQNHLQCSAVSHQQQFLNCGKPYAIGKKILCITAIYNNSRYSCYSLAI